MSPEFRFPGITYNPNGFGGTFQDPLRLGSCVLEQMRFPELGKILESCEFVQGFSEGAYATSVGLASRDYEQAAMLLHGDEHVRLLAAPLETTGRPYRTILVMKRAYPAAIQAGLEYLRLEGFKKEIDQAVKGCAGGIPNLAVSTAIANQLSPLITHWELAAGYQQAVIAAAGGDVHFIDWSKEPDNPCRRIVIMGQYLPHMREANSRASYEDASRLCANNLLL